MTSRTFTISFLALLISSLAVTAALADEGRLRAVMLGDSLTAGCDWAGHLPQVLVDNQGISGNTTGQIMARLDKVIAAKPDLVFIQAGINDLGGQRREEVILDNHWAIWKSLRAELPEARLYLVSLLPVAERRYPGWNEKIKELNLRLRQRAEEQGLVYIDLFPLLTNDEGQLASAYTYDGLHLTAAGYEVWLAALRPHLQRSGQ